jgi:hypothetical protein
LADLPPPREPEDEDDSYDEQSPLDRNSNVDGPVLRPPPSRIGRSVRPAESANARFNRQYPKEVVSGESIIEKGEQETQDLDSLASYRAASAAERPAQVKDMSHVGRKATTRLRNEGVKSSREKKPADVRTQAEVEDDGIDARTVGPHSSISQQPSMPGDATVVLGNADVTKPIQRKKRAAQAASVEDATASPDGIKSAEIEPGSSISNQFDPLDVKAKTAVADVEAEDDNIPPETIVAGDSVSQVGRIRPATRNKAARPVSAGSRPDAVDQTTQNYEELVERRAKSSILEEDDSGSIVPGDSVSQAPSVLNDNATNSGRAGRGTVVGGREERVRRRAEQEKPESDAEEDDDSESRVESASATPAPKVKRAARPTQDLPAELHHREKPSVSLLPPA